METYNADHWARVISRGPIQLAASRDCAVDVRRGLPSLTITGYPDVFGARVVDYLREWGWLLPYRVTVYVPRPLRKGPNAPSTQSIASYVQSACLHAQRAALTQEETDR